MDGHDRPLQKHDKDKKMGKIIRVDFSKRGKDLYYMQKEELKVDRAIKRLTYRNACAIKRNKEKMMNM